MNQNQKEHFFQLLEQFTVGMLGTTTGSGGVHVRPMAVAEFARDEETLAFLTSLDSPKVRELEMNPRVFVTFQAGSEYVSLSGFGEISTDRNRLQAVWKEPFKVWFPKGVTDPELGLFSVKIERGEYWDNSGLNKVRYAFEAAKAYISGERPRVVSDEQHGKVTL